MCLLHSTEGQFIMALRQKMMVHNRTASKSVFFRETWTYARAPKSNECCCLSDRALSRETALYDKIHDCNINDCSRAAARKFVHF